MANIGVPRREIIVVPENDPVPPVPITEPAPTREPVRVPQPA